MCVHSKRFMKKIIFIAALARPRFDASCNMIFDGKVGIWPFTENVKAKRSSKNRPNGSNELKPVVSVKKRQVRDMSINNIISAIIEKWPRIIRNDGSCEKVFTQQDNVGPHVCVHDAAIFAASSVVPHLDIKMVVQSAMSLLDLNISDLGSFNSLHFFLHYRSLRHSYKQLCEIFQSAFNGYKLECKATFGWFSKLSTMKLSSRKQRQVHNTSSV